MQNQCKIDSRTASQKRRGHGKDFRIWLNPAQQKELPLIVEKVGATSAAAWIKHLVFGTKYRTKKRVIIHTADPELLRNIAQIGNNINQIAKAIHQADKITKEHSLAISFSLAIIAENMDDIAEVSKSGRQS